jgi:hypothetical protein
MSIAYHNLYHSTCNLHGITCNLVEDTVVPSRRRIAQSRKPEKEERGGGLGLVQRILFAAPAPLARPYHSRQFAPGQFVPRAMSRQRAGEMLHQGDASGPGCRGLPPLPDKGPSARAGSGRPPGRRFRATLTKEQAALIYTLRPPDKDDPNPNKMAGNSQLLSKQFGVSPKAVRDVWNRRTWAHATKDAPNTTTAGLEVLENNLDGDKAGGSKALQDQPAGRHAGMNNFRSPGRPVGSKDSKPRRRRSNAKAAFSGLPGGRSYCGCVSVCASVRVCVHARARAPACPGGCF